ncbi:MAG: GNAT family N-acetyltransferase [Bacteroidota bacterium]
MSDLALRPVRRTDLDALVTLCAEHAAYEGCVYDQTGKAQRLGTLLFGEGPGVFGFVATQADRLIGFATWMPQLSTWDAATYAHLDCLYLCPEARGRGLGRRLVACVVQAATAAGCTRMEWQTPTSNASAIRFYDRLGATSKAKRRFYLDGDAWQALHAPPLSFDAALPLDVPHSTA